MSEVVDPSPVHPGEILSEEFLKPLGVSQSHLATRIGLATSSINGIVKKRRQISVEMARRLARFFGTSIEFWLDLQQSYDLKMSQAEYPDLESKITPHVNSAKVVERQTPGT